MTPIAQPKLNYLAPEYAMTSACDPGSDMFSVGVLICALYNSGQPVLDSMNDWSTFKKNVSQVICILLLLTVPNLNRREARAKREIACTKTARWEE